VDDVFRRHPVTRPARVQGELRLNPLYEIVERGDRVLLQLRFPSDDYADEFAACRRYLPAEAQIRAAALEALGRGEIGGELDELVERRVVLDLPRRYF
jgi:hypothetical protein